MATAESTNSVFSEFPSSLDGFEHLAVLGRGVRAREGPDLQSPVVAILTFLRSPIDYGAGLVREAGMWRLAFFAAGDSCHFRSPEIRRSIGGPWRWCRWIEGGDLSRAVPRAAAALWSLVVLACGPRPPASEQPPAASTASLDGREWTLVDLGQRPAPLRAGGRPATIQFDPTNGRAAGFAGCNRYGAEYTIAGDSLTFGPAISTKMACADGDQLERGYLAVLPEVRRYELTDSTLVLSGPGAPLARFRAP